jgi:V/A-type H+/Na+-transporting ATPase subunit F
LYKTIVITDPDTADGFRLAGVEVQVVEEPDAARARLAILLDDDSAGIIVINEAMAVGIDDRLQKKIDSLYRPIVISLPVREKLEIAEDHHEYLSRLIRRAIGLDITLRRG